MVGARVGNRGQMRTSADDVDGFAVDGGAELGAVDRVEGSAAHLIVDEGLQVGGFSQQVNADLGGVFEVGGGRCDALLGDGVARSPLGLHELDMENDFLRGVAVVPGFGPGRGRAPRSGAAGGGASEEFFR